MTCAHDLALNPDRVLRMHLPDDDRRENIMIGHAVFEITGYCTPCMVPNVMRKEAEPGFTGSFMYDFAGIGGLLLKPLNNETIKVGDSFRQISRGY